MDRDKVRAWWDDWPRYRYAVLTAISRDKKQIDTCTFDREKQGKGDEFVAWVKRYNESLEWNVYFTLNPPDEIPKPTAVVFSGGGYQGFWRLKEPVPVQGEEVLYEDAKQYNLALEIAFGGDACSNVDRLLRLPGTTNWPDEHKRKKGRVPAPAEIAEFDPMRIYDISRFKKAEATSYSGHKAQVSAADVERVEDVNDLGHKVSDLCKVVIVQGSDPDNPDRFPSRSEALFFVCCELARAGVRDQVIFNVITDRGFKISESVLDKGRNAEGYAKRQIERARVETEAPEWVRDLNREHAIIKSHGGRLRVLYEKPDGSIDFMLRDDFKSFYEYDRVAIGTDAQGNVKYGPKGHNWFTHEAARRYDFVAFIPSEDTPANVYNLFRGWSVTPREGNYERWAEFVREVICCYDDDYLNYLTDWAAHLFQKPDEPGQVAVVLRGKQGIGKGYFAKTLGSLMGRHFAHVKTLRHLLGNFNAHLRNKLLVFGDEVFGTGEQSARNVLKAMVTEETHDIEQKGVDVTEGEARYFRLIMSSNEGWAVPAELDDRRFFVLDAVHPLQDDERSKSDYFEALTDWAEHGGREALLHYLLTRDISKFNHRLRPRTAALVSQQLMSLSGPQKVIYNGLYNGTLTTHKVDGQRVFAATRLLREQHELRVDQETALGLELSKAAGANSRKETVDGRQVRGFWLPPLPNARENWAEAHKLNVRWPEDPDTWEGVEEDNKETPF